MIEIKEYEKKYDNDIKKFAPGLLKEIQHHKSVLAFSRAVAVENKKAIGVAFLKKDTLFEHFLTDTLPEELSEEYDGTVFIEAEFQVLMGHPEEAEVSEALLYDLMETFTEIEGDFPDTEIVMRLWCSEKKTGYMDLLKGIGFFESGKSYEVMERKLGGEAFSEITKKNRIKPLDIERKRVFKEYLDASGDGFTFSDSENEIKFRKTFGKGDFYGKTDGEKLISSVTVWPLPGNGIATENIFCRKAYRRQGHTEELLKEVLDPASKKGYKFALLHVLSGNTPAIKLYEKLGYVKKYRLIEMHFE